MEKELFIILLKRFMQGSLKKEELREFLSGFQRQEAKENLDEYYMQCWIKSKGCKVPQDVLQRVSNKLNTNIKSTNDEWNNRFFSIKITWIKWSCYAAVITLIMVSSTFLGVYFGNDRTNMKLATKKFVVIADKGQRASVILADGTKVWLNSNTTLEYNNLFGEKNRSVKLIGEAYFDVAKDSTKEFIVDAGQLSIKVLGTSFNVKAYREDKLSIATLINGSIRTEVGDSSYLLKPDESLVYNKSQNKLHIGHGNSKRTAMWRNNEIVFNGESLEEIAVLLNRLYNVSIEFESEDVKSHKFSGVIKNNSLDNVIELISLTAPISYIKENSTIRIKGN